MKLSSSILAAGVLATVATAAPSYFDKRDNSIDFVGVLPHVPSGTTNISPDCDKPTRGGQSPRRGRGGLGGARGGRKYPNAPTQDDPLPDDGGPSGRGGMSGGSRGGSVGGRGRGGRGGSIVRPGTGSGDDETDGISGDN